ncbi:MAG: SsrA-binding protein SmpB [Actinobacteria bacterium]|nr:MAG: SsrA-binding protein SmpB [Actinomycetota bacterium]
MVKETGRKVIAVNRRARHDYAIEDTWEAGLVLQGTEVKSLRAGRASLVDGYAEVRNGEVWLINVHIPEYDQGTWTNHEPRRPRKLLLHDYEINRLIGKIKQSGLTLIPMQLYFKDGKAKVEIGLGRGKKSHDKRQDIAAREAKRDAERAVAAARRRAH